MVLKQGEIVLSAPVYMIENEVWSPAKENFIFSFFTLHFLFKRQSVFVWMLFADKKAVRYCQLGRQ